ncbi:MAG: LPS export ABC transporter permease LptG [Minwuia sp.]|uniref:LPS export ABC transporter permease LptG n=1 Tax=Minwuia sp. TaxID=2493630 RepID=UPI003A89FB23
MLGASMTLNFYLIRHFLIGIGIVLALLALVMFTAETVEHLRRASNKPDVGFGLVLQMSLYKLPSIMGKLWPFVALFGAMLALTRLSRSSELVVARSAGVSVWQILGPLVVTAALLGTFLIMVLNPLAAALTSRYEQKFNAIFKGQSSQITVSANTGLWLRELSEDGQQVIYARGVAASGTVLDTATFFTFGNGDQFARRIDAREAVLGDRQWRLTEGTVTAPDQPPESFDVMAVPTTLTLSQIVDSLATPETFSFWQLPGFIEVLENAGFNGLAHRLYFHSLLALPLLLAAMVLLAATFCLRISVRQGGTGWVFFLGAMSGFAVFFITDLVEAFGSAGKLPVMLAAWTPAAVTSMCAMAAMFHLEDG